MSQNIALTIIHAANIFMMAYYAASCDAAVVFKELSGNNKAGVFKGAVTKPHGVSYIIYRKHPKGANITFLLRFCVL